MDTLSFLQRVLPSEGWYCLMTVEDGTVRHGFFDSVEGLAKATIRLDATGITTYYAVSAFKEKGKRKQDNVRATKVVALDLDVGTEDKKYPSWKEAVQDLARFIDKAALPKPMIVRSGVGLHVYWVLTEELEPSEWKPLAQAVKALAITYGLRLDPTVTSDSARVLRATGTTNYRNNKQVNLLVDAAPIDPTMLRSSVGGSDAPAPQVVAPSRNSGLADSLAVKYDFPPANADVVSAKCLQIKWATENQGEVAEPLWYNILGIAAFCKDPEVTAVKWSHDHPEFDRNSTLRKMYQWQSCATGPTTCNRLEDERPNGCKGCKFKGKIGSPARLGVQYEEAATVAPDPVVHEVNVPKPFKRTTHGIKVTIDDTDVDVCPFDLYPVSYGRDESLGYEVVRFMWDRSHTGWQSLVLRQAYLTDGHREFASAIADQGIVLNSKKQTEFFQLMLRSYMDALRKKRAMTNLYSTMGWKDGYSQFIIGDVILRREADGSIVDIPTNMASNSSRVGQEMWSQSGTLEDWVAFTGLLEKTNMPWHMFALLVGVSAPLYVFCGLKGITLSLFGETGAGKTLIQYWQQSVWGNPERLHFAAKFTENSLYARMALLSHMPMTIDETTILDAKDLGSFLYSVTQGRDKARLNRNAEEREVREWALPVTISTNRSTTMTMTASGLDTDAQMARLLEIAIPTHQLFKKDSTTGKRIYHFLRENHGTMGREFVRRLMALGVDGIRAMIDEHYRTFQTEYNASFSGQERYWEQMIVLADLTGKLCSEWGLLAFDHRVATKWVLEQLGLVRAVLDDNRLGARDLISEYFNEFASTAVTVMHTVGRPPVVEQSRMPRGEIRIRFDVYRQGPTARFDKGTVLLDRTHFKKWLAYRGGDYKTLMADLEAEAILATPKSSKAYLGKDTPAKLGQCYVIGMNLSHHWLRGILEDADQTADDLAYGKLQSVR